MIILLVETIIQQEIFYTSLNKPTWLGFRTDIPPMEVNSIKNGVPLSVPSDNHCAIMYWVFKGVQRSFDT